MAKSTQSLSNKVIVITGASSGFGRGAALKFAKAGANLVLAARRDELLEDVAEQCRRSGVKAIAVETDVSEQKQVELLAGAALRHFARIDVWVNNAGVGALGPYTDVPIAEHEKVIRTNLLGTMYGSYVALEEFYRRRRGTLINVGSFAGYMGAPLMGSYAASKFGIRGLDMALRQEAKQAGFDHVHICTVAPVSMDTPFFQHQANYSGKPVHPYGQVYDPKKVIDVIYRMASSEDPEDEVIVGSSGKVARAIQRISPELLENIYGSKSYKAHYKQSGSAPAGSGAVNHPVDYGNDLYGGWLAKQRSQRAGKLALGIAIPAVLGYLAWQRVRQPATTRTSEAA